MNKTGGRKLDAFMARTRENNPNEPEFHQAVFEVAQHVFPFMAGNPRYEGMKIMERLTEPDRIIIFRVCWEDDQGKIHVNRGYRVQNNNAIGPYKGGMRFHPSVNLSILKFLAFEQTFKNSLTGLPMGGGKGGSDFDPKDRSDSEVMRFCQSFMTELAQHIGHDRDVPAGDIGVGPREIGYLFGQYKRLTHEFTGALTGKGMEYGGSHIRIEATGYGTVYFMEDMLTEKKDTLEGKTVVISGSGNVSQFACEKAIQLGAKVVTMSDSDGFVHDPDGISGEELAFIKELKNVRRGRISEFAKEFGYKFYPGKTPWAVPCDIALPCATENEINGKDAETLVKNGCIGVSEGANMPTTVDAVEVFKKAKVLHGPAKAANAGGVAVSGLEMSQNRARLTWHEKKLQRRLRNIMSEIHAKCLAHGWESQDYVDYFKGANIAGFKKVADAMLAYGVV